MWYFRMGRGFLKTEERGADKPEVRQSQGIMAPPNCRRTEQQ